MDVLAAPEEGVEFVGAEVVVVGLCGVGGVGGGWVGRGRHWWGGLIRVMGMIEYGCSKPKWWILGLDIGMLFNLKANVGTIARYSVVLLLCGVMIHCSLSRIGATSAFEVNSPDRSLSMRDRMWGGWSISQPSKWR